MKTAHLASVCSLSLLMTACGSSDTSVPPRAPASLAMRSAQLSTPPQHAPEDYWPVGQTASLAFDAKGGVSYNGTALDAATVTSLLTGGVVTDPSRGKYLAFAAYRYTRANNATAYFIVQHLGDRMSNLSDGSLAIWTQE